MTPRHPLSQEFHDLCDQMKALHDRKQADYGQDDNPFSNVSASREWGLPPWVGVMVRATDKVRRLQKAAQGHTLTNEGVEDSLMDLAVYSLIALVLYREQGRTHTRRRKTNSLSRLKSSTSENRKAGWHVLLGMEKGDHQ